MHDVATDPVLLRSTPKPLRRRAEQGNAAAQHLTSNNLSPKNRHTLNVLDDMAASIFFQEVLHVFDSK
jgi:hypothetical protein